MAFINTLYLNTYKSLDIPTLPPCSLASFIILGQISRISSCFLLQVNCPREERVASRQPVAPEVSSASASLPTLWLLHCSRHCHQRRQRPGEEQVRVKAGKAPFRSVPYAWGKQRTERSGESLSFAHCLPPSAYNRRNNIEGEKTHFKYD